MTRLSREVRQATIYSRVDDRDADALAGRRGPDLGREDRVRERRGQPRRVDRRLRLGCRAIDLLGVGRLSARRDDAGVRCDLRARGGIRVRRFLRSRSDVGVRRLRGTWDEVDVRRDLRVRRRLRVRGGPVQICQPVLPRLDTTVDGHGADPRVAGERGARATRQPHGERIDDGKPAGHPAVHAPDGRGAVGERDAVAQLHDVRRPRSALGRAGSREEQRRDHPRDEGRGSKCGRRRREQGCGVSHQRRVIRSRRRALRVSPGDPADVAQPGGSSVSQLRRRS